MPSHQERRDPLPKDYQFPTPHLHRFNGISGYCACGLQYLPHLLPTFEHGGRVGQQPPSWMPDTRSRFVTTLPVGATVETPKSHCDLTAVTGFDTSRDPGDER